MGFYESVKIVIKLVFGFCKNSAELVFGLCKIGAKSTFGLLWVVAKNNIWAFVNRFQISIWAL